MAGAVQGQASYYTEWKSNAGSCGFIPTNGDIAAVNPQFMPAKCKQCILISYQGKELKVQATDTCPGCSATKIDLSDTAFQKLDSLSKGILQIQWKWVPC
jgi:expansin (peptidoglycan-binding protein)